MGIFYQTWTEKKPFRGGKPNPNKKYAEHWQNSRVLLSIMVSGDFEGRIDARNEMAVAERKMKYWENQPGFVLRDALALIQMARKSKAF